VEEKLGASEPQASLRHTGHASDIDGTSTRARYKVLALMFLVTGITYLDRVCISAAAPRIMADLRLTDLQLGYAFGVFALSYGLFEIPMGWWGDRIGQRKMLTRIVVCWSAFTALTGLVRSYSALIFARFVFGAAEAGAFPTVARALARWFPPRQRGRVTGLMWTGARLGGSLAPPLATLLITWIDWRATFILFGAVGIVWSAGFWIWYRDDPADHPAVNPTELAYIRPSGPSADVAHHHAFGSTPWKRVFTSGTMWALFWMYFATSYGFWFFLTWLPTYLMREHGMTVMRAGFLSAMPLAFGAVTCLAGGALSDWLAHRTGSLRWGRRFVGLTGFTLTAAGFAAAAAAEGPYAAVICLTLAAGAMDMAVPVAWAACLDVGGRFGGTTTGFMNTGSSISAMISPIAAAKLFEVFGSFHAMFASAAAVYLLAGLLWLKIDPSHPIDD
jgi:sugar phosphate permease